MQSDEIKLLPPPEITEKEQEVFGTVFALLAKGGRFLGNHWVNYPGKKGIFEIKVELGGRVFVFETTRCFPEIFSLPSEEYPKPAKSS